MKKDSSLLKQNIETQFIFKKINKWRILKKEKK